MGTAHPLIVGIGHRKRTGKDLFASLLRDALSDCGMSAEKRSFAGPLKAMAFHLWGWAGLNLGEYYDCPDNAQMREVPLPALGKTPRQIWIEFGIKMREIYQDTWLNLTLKSPTQSNVLIIPDVRFPNEAEAILKSGGILIKMERKTGAQTDAADDALANWTQWPLTIHNNSGVEHLRKLAAHLAQSIRKATGNEGSLLRDHR